MPRLRRLRRRRDRARRQGRTRLARRLSKRLARLRKARAAKRRAAAPAPRPASQPTPTPIGAWPAVVTANIKGSSTVVHALVAELDPLMIGLTEAARYIQAVEEKRATVPAGYRLLHGTLPAGASWDVRRGRHDCALLVADEVEVDNYGTLAMSPAVKRLGRVLSWAPERHLFEADVRVRGSAGMVIVDHPNANSRSPRLTPTTRAHALHAERREPRLEVAARGRWALYLADANVGRSDRVPWSPHPVLARLGFWVLSDGVDVLAAKGLRLGAARVLPKGTRDARGRPLTADHPVLIAHPTGG